MTKVIGISFCVLFCSIILKEKNKTFSLILSVSGGVLCFLSISDKIYSLYKKILDLSLNMPLATSYIKLMMKILCIILVTQFVVDICRDNGENALASFTEVGTKILVLSLIMPLFESIIDIVSGLIK